MKRATVAAALAGWRSRVQSAKSGRVLANKLLARMNNRCAAAALAGWRSRVLTKARRRAAEARAFRLMTRTLHKTLSLALSTWVDNVKELMRVRDGLQQLVTRWRWGPADIARHVIQPILDHLVQRILNPRVLSCMAFHDVASDVSEALPGGGCRRPLLSSAGCSGSTSFAATGVCSAGRCAA